jgi:hypothetical protein
MFEGPAAARHEEHDLESGAFLVTLGSFNDSKGAVGMNDPSGDNDSNRPRGQHKDFDNSANPLWSLYTKGVRSRDEARIQTLKDDMDGILLFVSVHPLMARVVYD